MKLKTKVSGALVAAQGALLGLTTVALAADQPPITLTSQLSGVLPTFTIADAVSFIVRIIIIAAFIVAFIFLLIGGLRWITAGGDEKAVAGARGMVTGALIGLVIVLAAFAIIRLIEFFFNVNIISGALTIPTIAPAP